jgi:hypothetical protein
MLAATRPKAVPPFARPRLAASRDTTHRNFGPLSAPRTAPLMRFFAPSAPSEPGVLFAACAPGDKSPFAARRLRACLTCSLSASRVSHPLDGFLLPEPRRFVSPDRHPWGFEPYWSTGATGAGPEARWPQFPRPGRASSPEPRQAWPLLHPRPLGERGCFQHLRPRSTAGLSPKDVRSGCGSWRAPSSAGQHRTAEAVATSTAENRLTANTSANQGLVAKREPPTRDARRLRPHPAAEATMASTTPARFLAAPQQAEARLKTRHTREHRCASRHTGESPKRPWVCWRCEPHVHTAANRVLDTRHGARPATFASPRPAPRRRNDREVEPDAASASDPGRTREGHQEQLPWSCAASPEPTPNRRNDHEIDPSATSASNPGRTGKGRQEQRPRSCAASPSPTPRRRSVRGSDLGTKSTSHPGQAGAGRSIQSPRSCKERSSPLRGEPALLGHMALHGVAPKRATELGQGLNR